MSQFEYKCCTNMCTIINRHYTCIDAFSYCSYYWNPDYTHHRV